jgi:hypothetical protein
MTPRLRPHTEAHPAPSGRPKAIRTMAYRRGQWAPLAKGASRQAPRGGERITRTRASRSAPIPLGGLPAITRMSALRYQSPAAMTPTDARATMYSTVGQLLAHPSRVAAVSA